MAIGGSCWRKASLAVGHERCCCGCCGVGQAAVLVYSRHALDG